MAERELFRGRVTAYPQEDKGLVEVAVGGLYDQADTVYARAEQNVPGAYWLPEIGDVVEVELPGLTGQEARIVRVRRGEGDGQAEECWTENNDVKQLRTRSGHTVTLSDAPDHTAITVRTAGGLELRLEDGGRTAALAGTGEDGPSLLLDWENSTAALAAGKKLTLSCAGASISIDSGGNIRVEAKGKLSLAAQEIELEAQGPLTAQGRQARLAGSLSAEVEGRSGLDLTSGGVTQVKGGVIKLN